MFYKTSCLPLAELIIMNLVTSITSCSPSQVSTEVSEISSTPTIPTTTSTASPLEPGCDFPCGLPGRNLIFLGCVSEIRKRYFLVETSLLPEEAAEACQSQGLQLASVEAPAEGDFLATELKNHKQDECYWTSFEMRLSEDGKETMVWSSANLIPSIFHGFGFWIRTAEAPPATFHGCVLSDTKGKLVLDKRESIQEERKGALCQDLGKVA